MLIHVVRMKRIMYHHHILSRNSNETIMKICMKQNEDTLGGDWYSLLIEDFKFIGIEINEEEIQKTSKVEYKKKIKKLVHIAAFKEMNKIKLGMKKVKDVEYQSLEVQRYLTNPDFSTETRNLLYSLRSKMHPAKSNFKKMNAGNLLCSQGCSSEENQVHIFENCQILKVKGENIKLDLIFSDTGKQKEVMGKILPIEVRRLKIIENKIQEDSTPAPGKGSSSSTP